MEKVISIILLSLVLFSFCFAQQQLYGCKYSGKGDILSDYFIIQNGFVLDSIVSSYGRTYSFEYNEQGKLKRDINYYTFLTTVIDHARPLLVVVPGSRDYYYTVGGKVDSVGYGHWENNVWVNDSSGFKYHYSFDGKITSIIYSAKDSVTRVDENSYDSAGNLILNRVISSLDTVFNSSEYDSLNRVTLRKRYYSENSSNYPYITQYIYQYDSSGNINCTMTNISTSDTSDWNYSFKFDPTGKIKDEIFCAFNDTFNIAFNYDESGKILNMGPNARFHYNTEGNLDTIAILHPVYSGYLGGKGTLLDSYGNTISLFEIGEGICNLYYSQKVTGVTISKSHNRAFTIYQNYPNPFNPKTKITYTIVGTSRQVGTVWLRVYDILGREIAVLVNEVQSPGMHSIEWNGRNSAGRQVGSGIYFYKLNTGNYSETKKMILLK